MHLLKYSNELNMNCDQVKMKLILCICCQNILIIRISWLFVLFYYYHTIIIA